MKCDMGCGRNVDLRDEEQRQERDRLAGRVTTLCRVCFNEHLAERARRTRRQGGINMRALSLMRSTAGHETVSLEEIEALPDHWSARG